MSPRHHVRPGSALWPLLVLVLFTLVLTWPTARSLGTHVVDRQDPLLNAWIMAWEAHQLLRDPLRLFQANIFYPYPYALAFSEILLSTTALVLPVRWAGATPILTYNLAFLLAFFTTALGGYLFALYLTGRRLAALVAAVAYAFSPYRFGHLSQVQLLAFGWLPLALLALDRLLSGRGPLWRNAALFMLFYLLQALASFYSAIFAAVASALYAVGLWVRRRVPPSSLDAEGEGPHGACAQRRRRDEEGLRRIGALLVAGAGVALVMIPFAWPYLQVQRELGAGWSLADNETFSASLQAYAYAPPETRLWGPLTRGLAYVYGPCCPPDTLFPGLTLLALAALALWRGRGRRRWLLAGLLAVGFLLSFGPTLHLRAGQPTGIRLPYGWLFAHVPAFSALRAPVRWAVLVTLGLSLLAAWGTAWVPRGSVGARFIAPVLALVLVLVEFAAVPLRLVPAPAAPPVAAWLAQQPPTRIVELPLAAELPTESVPPDHPRRAWEVSRLLEHQLASTRHWHTTPDGYSGYIPPSHGDFAREMQSFPSTRSVALLQGLDIEYVVLHTADLPAARRDHIARRLPHVAALSVAAEVEGATVLRVAPGSPEPALGWSLVAPAEVAAGEPFEVWLVVRADGRAVVPPTRRIVAAVVWDGRTVDRRVSLPLMVEQVAVVPLPVTAPGNQGAHRLTVRVTDEEQPPGSPLQTEVIVVEAPAPAPARPLAVSLSEAEVPTFAAPGSAVPISLTWRALQPLDHYASLSLRLVAPDGQVVAQRDGPPGGDVGTLAWQPGEPYGATWQLDVPPGLPAGEYSLQVLWYEPATGQRALLWDDQAWVEMLTAGMIRIGE